MSGLGLLKGGERKSDAPTYRSSIDFSTYELPAELDGLELNEDPDFAPADNDSVTTAQSSVVFEEVLLPADRVKQTMKSLKYGVKQDASKEEVMTALTSVQKLANTTYAVRSELGERGVCEALGQLFERHLHDAAITTEILKAMNNMLLSDDENKVRMAKLGGCKFTVDAIRLHSEDPVVLELCCKAIVEFGNGKFVSMLETEFRKKEMERDLQSRERKRQTLTPNRIANMTPTAAAAARRALQELDAIEEMENESKNNTARTDVTAESKHSHSASNSAYNSHRHSRDGKGVVDPNECLQDENMWDNRLALCEAGACECLTVLMHNLVVVAPTPAEHAGSHMGDHHFSSSLTSIPLPSIFEDEDVVVSACAAVASLAANTVCCRRFARDGRMAKCLSALLLHFKHWNLMTASAWAIINLCADCKAGNKEKLGAAGAAQNLCRGLLELCTRHEEYGQLTGYDRLLEYYVWALLNLVIANTHNQDTLREQDREPLIEQLLEARWVKPGCKDKCKQILKHLGRR